MYERIASRLTNTFVRKGIIPQEKQTVYAYGFEVLISNVVYTLIFILIALLTKTFFESILFWVSFYIIRSTAGGFHARTYRACHLLFILNHSIFIILIKAVFHMVYPIMVFGVIIICAVIVFALAPVDHPNKRFSANEFKKFKLRSRVYSVIIFSLSVIWLIFFECDRWCFSYAIGTLSATVSLIYAKIIHIKRKEK